MSNAPGTTPYAPLPIHGGPKGLPSPQEKKTLLSLVSSSFLSLVRRHPFLSSIVVFVIITGTVAGVTNRSYTRDKQYLYSQIPPNKDGIALVGHTSRFEEVRQLLFVQWEVLGCGTYRLPTYPPPTGILEAVGCGPLNRAVDVYLNGDRSPQGSYDPARFPLGPTGEKQYVYRISISIVGLYVHYSDTNVAPFDAYSLGASVFTIDKATDESIPIVALTVGGATSSFDVSSTEVETTSNYTYDSGTGQTAINALIMCLFLVNWALTTASIYIVVLVVFGREGMDDAVLLLPVTIILTIPSLRGLYPGSPPFGIYIDTFGFILQMMTVAVCSTILVYSVAIPKFVQK